MEIISNQQIELKEGNSTIITKRTILIRAYLIIKDENQINDAIKTFVNGEKVNVIRWGETIRRSGNTRRMSCFQCVIDGHSQWLDERLISNVSLLKRNIYASSTFGLYKINYNNGFVSPTKYLEVKPNQCYPLVVRSQHAKLPSLNDLQKMKQPKVLSRLPSLSALK